MTFTGYTRLPQSYEELYRHYGWLIDVRLNTLNKRKRHDLDDVRSFVWAHLLQSNFLEKFHGWLDSSGYSIPVQALQSYLYVSVKNAYLNFCRTYGRRYRKDAEGVLADNDLIEVIDRLDASRDNPETLLQVMEAGNLVVEVLATHTLDTDEAQRLAWRAMGHVRDRGSSIGIALKRAGYNTRSRKQVDRYVQFFAAQSEREVDMVFDRGLTARKAVQLQLSAVCTEVHNKTPTSEVLRMLPQIIRTREAVKPETRIAAKAVTTSKPMPVLPTPALPVTATGSPNEEPILLSAQQHRSVPQSVPERIAAAMGSHELTAVEIAEALRAADIPLNTTNVRGYILSVLASSSMRVHRANGEYLRDQRTARRYSLGRVVKVHRFTAVQRGKYRVSTAEDIAQEVRRILRTNEVYVCDEAPSVQETTIVDQGDSMPTTSEATVPERIAAVMGDRIWDVVSLEQAIIAAGDGLLFTSSNPRQYLIGALTNSTIRVQTANGDLRDKDGKVVRVPRFASAGRGEYRVATIEDIRRAARSAVPSLSEDAVIDVRPLQRKERGHRPPVSVNVSEADWPKLEQLTQHLQVSPQFWLEQAVHFSIAAATGAQPASSQPTSTQEPSTLEDALRNTIRKSIRYETGPFPGFFGRLMAELNAIKSSPWF